MIAATKPSKPGGGPAADLPVPQQIYRDRETLNASLGFNPNNSNIAWSSSKAGLGVVSNLSPEKIELAPAIKHKACSATLISARPALNLTIAANIIILAVAIILTISQISTFGLSWRGV